MDQAIKDRLVAMAAEMECPACGGSGLELTFRLKAKPLGTYSLAGQQMKVSATEVPVIRCPACGVEGEGRM